jgi:hypothetical protein
LRIAAISSSFNLFILHWAQLIMAARRVDYVVCRRGLVPLLVNTMYVGAAIKMSSSWAL